MSKIQTIQPNFQPAAQGANLVSQMQRKKFDNQNFNGSEAATKDVLNHVEKELTKNLGNSGKFFKWLGDGKGEVQSQLITALFTTTLAPLMIVTNPFTKNKTKEDKAYLAWRQPISAVVALGCSTPLTIFLLNKSMDKIYNEGYVKSMDLRIEPSKDYLEKSFKKAYEKAENENKLKEFLSKYDEDVDSAVKEKGFNNGKVKRSYKKGCLDGYVKAVGKERKELFANLISAKPDSVKINNVNDILINNVNAQDKHLVKVLGFDDKELKAFLDTNNLHNRTVGDLLKDKFKVEFFEEGALKGKLKPNIINKKLSEIKALDFLEEFGLIAEKSITDSDLKDIILRHRQGLDKNKDALAKPLATGVDKAEEIFNVLGKDTSRNVEMTVGEEIGKAKSISLGQFFHQIQYKTSDGTVQNLMDMKMSDALAKFKDIFKGKIKGVEDKTALKDFAKNIIAKSAKRMSSDAKSYKFYAGIAFNVFLTAVSCTVLNWLYPRIVELVAPNLIKARTNPGMVKNPEAAKGGNK